MDNKEYHFQRHLKLWEEQSKTVKRTMFAGLLFGLFLLIKVLTPFVDISGKTGDKQNEICELKLEQNNVAELNKTLDQLQKTLNEVQKTIRLQPWMKEKNKLISTLKEIRNRSPRSGNWQEYQDAADATISTITEQVGERIIQPLEEALHQGPQVQEDLPELSRGVDALRVDMDKWEQVHLGKRWYTTFFMKDKEMRELTYSLENNLNVIYRLIRSEQKKIDMKRRDLIKIEKSLKNDIQEKESALDELQREMQKLLPEWFRDLLSIEQMIQLFPLIILSLLVYVIATAHSLTGHHEKIIENIGFPEAERSDPSNSSLWTITYRGRAGTTATLITYVSFILAMCLFYEWGCLLLDKWMASNSQLAWASSKNGFIIMRWIGRILFMAATTFIFFSPFYGKKK